MECSRNRVGRTNNKEIIMTLLGHKLMKAEIVTKEDAARVHRQLVALLGRNDEEEFKALKMLRGYASMIGV